MEDLEIGGGRNASVYAAANDVKAVWANDVQKSADHGSRIMKHVRQCVPLRGSHAP